MLAPRMTVSGHNETKMQADKWEKKTDSLSDENNLWF